MATRMRRAAAAPDLVKYGFFVLLALCVPLVLWADERFLINPADPHWKHVAPFKWLLLVHGLAGLTALTTGTLQMSSRIRRLRPALHRALGKVFIGSVSIAAPAALAITSAGFEPRSIVVEQWFQAGGWLISPWIAYACIRSGQMPLHKAWMMRSYAFTLIFIFSRVPDYFMPTESDQFLSDLLWSQVVVAALAPELILTVQTLWRIRTAKARHSAALAVEQLAAAE
jgi:uncharacterized membrane protein